MCVVSRLPILAALISFTSLTQAQAPAPAPSPDVVTPGELVIEPATLINLGFEWFIQGDANRNAAVQVSYRKEGTTEWQPALPLLRLDGERIYAESRVDVIAPNMFAGSVLDLEPDTAYEARFVMSDPDGVRGDGRRIVNGAHARGTAAVRRRPRLSRLSARLQGAEDRAVVRRTDVRLQLLVRRHRLGDVGTPARQTGRHDSRARRHLQVQPLRVHQRRRRVNRTVPLDGTYYLTADGTPDMPIAIKAAGDGEVDLRRRRQLRAVRREGRRLHLFRGHHVPERRDRHRWPARSSSPGSKGLTVKRSRFENVGAGIFTNYCGLEQLLHCRQHVHRHATIRST